MSDLKGLNLGVRAQVSDENFRNGSLSAVEYEPWSISDWDGRCRWSR